MPKAKAITQITITDLNDATPSESAPLNPEKGHLWLDTKNYLYKVYDGYNWVIVGDYTGEIEDLNNRILDIKQNIDNLTTTVKSTGGNNLLLNSSGVLGLENWTGVGRTETNFTFDARSCFNLQAGAFKQEVSLTNGDYYLGFKYKRISGTVTVKINGASYTLAATTLTDFDQQVKVQNGTFTIELIATANNSCQIGDMILAKGEKREWSQNINETITDTVIIGQGIEVKNSNKNTTLKMDADGTRIINATTKETVAEFTDAGTKTKQIEAEKGMIGGLLIQKIGSEVWISTVM